MTIVACAGHRGPHAPIDELTRELDAACMSGEKTCDEAARRYAAIDAPEARARRTEMLHEQCRRTAATCDELAGLLASGALPPPPRARMAADYERACGTSRPADEGACMAAALYGRRCDAGHLSACAAVAELGAAGRLGRRGRARAPALWKGACEAGHAPSCLALAARTEPSERAAWLARGCDLSSAEACFQLAKAHAGGHGVAIDQARARRLRGQACELDHGPACAELAEMTARGVGGGVDAHRAALLYARGCELRAPSACEARARALERGVGAKKADPAAAYAAYRAAAQQYRERFEEHESLEACVRLGVLAAEGSGMRTDRDEAKALFERACRGGHAEGCIRLASGGAGLDEQELQRHRPVLTRACRGGDGEACTLLARLGDPSGLEPSCAAGHGPSCAAAAMSLPLRSDAARALAERSCALADAAGCHLLGTILELVEPDLERALEKHRDACLWGHAPGCARAGILRLRGDLRHEPLAAASSLDRGCELGDPEACYELALLELQGERIGLDVPHAKRALERACRMGFGPGCGALGAALLRGRRLPRDLERGASLLRQACRDGDDGACLDLAEALGGQLPPSDVETREVLGTAATRGERRCEIALLTCHGDDRVAASAWSIEDGLARRQLAEPPRCGAELERTCNAGREALRRLCALDGAYCWPAARLVRTMAAGGLAASVVAAAEHEAAAVKWARPACARGDARACAVMHQAHDLGRGVPANAKESDRYRERACSLDPGFCP